MIGLFHICGQLLADGILSSSRVASFWSTAHREIHQRLEGEGLHEAADREANSFDGVIVEIVLLNVVFSLDSLITRRWQWLARSMFAPTAGIGATPPSAQRSFE
jgi:predicted tellurium resistance membrane protein TerC